MKKLLAIIILSLCFITSSQADDISDFQIEGMSIGDSLLDYLSEDEIKNNLVPWYKNNKMKTSEMTSSKFKVYSVVQLSYKKNDKNYIINNIAGDLLLNKNDCANTMNEINKDFKKIFKNYKIKKQTFKHPIDKSGKSIVIEIGYNFDNGDAALIQCYDMLKKTNYPSGLKLILAKEEFANWLRVEAYK